MMGSVGLVKKLLTDTEALATFRTTVPVLLVTEISPTMPPSSESSVMVLSSPSAAATPAAAVPRTPMVATGVVTTIESGPLEAILPLTKLKAP